MNITVNGNLQKLEQVINVTTLLHSMQLEGKRIAVEVNEEIVPRSQYHDTLLKNNDIIEIVHAIGGG